MKKRVFSAIQPTGDVHLGNYLGAIRHWVDLQRSHETIISIANLHALTIPERAEGLKRRVLELGALLFAAGIDPELTATFVQSEVSAHAALAWVLGCHVSMGDLGRMIQYKERSRRMRPGVSAGLFTYPVLMAADILLYDTDLVPVGDDQKQHIELARDTARRMNALYGELFKVPEPLIPPSGARIMGLEDPSRKMSKSDARGGQAVLLLDSPEVIRQKILRAKTDSKGEILFDEGREGVCNLLVLFQLFTGEPRETIEARFEGKGYVKLKRDLADLVIGELAPIQKRWRDFMDDRGSLDRLLTQGADKVRPVAERTYARVKSAIGLS